ncbi:DivIVA domain-containing protein [bacterium]|jgi:cell division initiation protein|nr:DivIVA domain-containing protein [Balneola sp.]MBR9916119.1 DivIVA domain-containing protein [bacterium]
MKLTPLEIKQQQFEKTLRGFDVADVQSFLTLVSNEVEHLLNKNKELEHQIDKLNDRVRHYERVEEALHETLQTTKESVAQKLDGAKAEAQNKIDKAEMQAEGILKEANHQRQQIRQNIQRLLEKREEIIAGMNSFLENSQESLSKFGKDEMGIFNLPKEDLYTGQDSAEERKPRFELDEEGPESEEMKSKKEEEIDLSLPPGTEHLDDILDEID